MDRLEFLKKSALVAAGGLATAVGLSGLISCSGSGSACANKAIGLQLYSLRELMAKDVPGTLKKIAAMGYTTLETADYSLRKIYGYAPAEFKKLAEGLGLTVSSAHIGGSCSPETKAEAMEWWKPTLDDHATTGCKYAIQPSLPAPATIEDVKFQIDYLNEVGALAKERGLRFGFHNHDGEFKTIDNKIILDQMIEGTEPENVVFELDVYWSAKGGHSAVEYLKKYPTRIPVLHIKDESILGESGTIDFEPIFDAFYANNMQDYYVEVERYTLPAENCVERSYDFLNMLPCVK